MLFDSFICLSVFAIHRYSRLGREVAVLVAAVPPLLAAAADFLARAAVVVEVAGVGLVAAAMVAAPAVVRAAAAVVATRKTITGVKMASLVLPEKAPVAVAMVTGAAVIVSAPPANRR